MDLFGIANNVADVVNQNTGIIYYQSNGFTIGAGAKQIPAYLDGVDGFGNIQALDAIDLKHMEGMNIQGVVRAIYVYGDAAGVIRPDTRGGDLINVCGQAWLVKMVLEHWSTWVKAAIQYQGPWAYD